MHGHRGRSGDPLYGIRNVLRCAAERLTDKQKARLAAAIAADERHDQVHIAWQCAQKVRAAYAHPDPAKGRHLAEQIINGFPSCPIPEIARLGRTLRQWKEAFLGYFTTGRANNGGAESINGLSDSTAASPEGSATGRTTGYACSSSPAASTRPHRRYEEPVVA